MKLYAIGNSDSVIYTFTPPTTFTPGPKLACGNGGGPTALAVARDGTAIVFDRITQEAYRVDMATGQCMSFLGKPDFGEFSLAYTESGGSDVLYACSQAGLARVDEGDGGIALIGKPPDLFPPCACGIRGDTAGNLFGLFEQTGGWDFVGLDKTTAAALSTQTLSIPNVLACDTRLGMWRFGGDYYLYTNDGHGEMYLWRYHPQDHSVVQLTPDASFDISVGGQSTCVE
jgi:hypothetical protein